MSSQFFVFFSSHKLKLCRAKKVKAVRNAAIIVGAHGAHLTNIIFAIPGTSVLEYSLRYGWCCDPVMEEDNNSGTQFGHHCTAPCKLYHKADYCSLCKIFGMRYHLLDPVYCDQRHETNPICVRHLHIDSDALAYVVASEYREVTHC